MLKFTYLRCRKMLKCILFYRKVKVKYQPNDTTILGNRDYCKRYRDKMNITK